MPEIDFHATEEYLQQQEQKQQQAKRQFTLSQNDLKEMDEMSFFGEQEMSYIEELNIDKEKAHQEPIVKEVLKEKKVNIDGTKAYVQNCLARQQLVNSLASMELDFYTKAALVTDQINDSSLFQIHDFISVRLDNIIYHSKEYSENIKTRLTEEEVVLYDNICKCVDDFKRSLYEKLRLNR